MIAVMVVLSNLRLSLLIKLVAGSGTDGKETCLISRWSLTYYLRDAAACDCRRLDLMTVYEVTFCPVTVWPKKMNDWPGPGRQVGDGTRA